MVLTTAMIADILSGDTDPRSFWPRMGEKYEIVDGEILEQPEMSAYSVEVANRINVAVLRHLFTDDRGVTGVEQFYHLPQPDDEGRSRRPDWSFVSYERWPKDRPWSARGTAREVVPDIAAEVVSPNDRADDLITKVREYLRGGVRLVWVVYPLAREIHAYWPGTNSVRVYFPADDLDAGDVLPGFRAPVGPLFPPTEPPPAPAATA